MADNYLQFSETLDALTKKQEAWLQQQLEPIVVVNGTEFPEDDAPDCDEPEYWGLRFLRDMKTWTTMPTYLALAWSSTAPAKTGTHGSPPKKVAIRAAWPTWYRSSSKSSARINPGPSPMLSLARSCGLGSSAAGRSSSRPMIFIGMTPRTLSRSNGRHLSGAGNTTVG